MKIGCVQNFKAQFTPESRDYLDVVEKQAFDSRRYPEYQAAKRIIEFNFPQGQITKLKSYPQVDTFVLTPNNPIQFTIKKNQSRIGERTSALDSYIRLAKEIRKISF